jgi:hypothetical protein
MLNLSNLAPSATIECTVDLRVADWGGGVTTTLPIVIYTSTLVISNMAALQALQVKSVLLFRGQSMIFMLFKETVINCSVTLYIPKEPDLPEGLSPPTLVPLAKLTSETLSCRFLAIQFHMSAEVTMQIWACCDLGSANIQLSSFYSVHQMVDLGRIIKFSVAIIL